MHILTLDRCRLAGVAVSALLPALAAAQVNDHLTCFKVRDTKTFDSANVDLDALTAEFGLQSCTIKGRAKRLCVPSTKSVTSIEGGTLSNVDGAAMSENRLCYKVRCSTPDIAAHTVSDQFGSRELSGFKVLEICTPAVFDATTTTTTSTTATTLADSLDDDFSGSSLDPSWSVLHPDRVTISVSGGALHLTPTATGGGNVWYQAGEGPLVYKEVTGDFDVATTITVRDPGNTSNPPPPEYRLAGILARDASAAPVNTVHVALGAGSNVQGTCYEYKSTDDSNSTWLATPTASASAQLRLRRSGTTVEMYWRATSGDTWTMIYSVARADLPAALQVGPMIYSVDSPALIEALFDDIVFQ
jgi:hypothetical protein